MCDPLFDMDSDNILGVSAGKDENPQDWTIEEQLALAWSTKVGYPLPERHWLARVALYNRIVKSLDERGAKTNYLKFLKSAFLVLAKDDDRVDHNRVKELSDEIDKWNFADMVQDLGYLEPSRHVSDTLQLLARLNQLPIYVTTSYFDFLERALQANGRKPHTQICLWSGQPKKSIQLAHRVDSEFVPSAAEPLVYHIYGLETYPESMVLSEDDYLDFLVKLAQDTSHDNPIVPLYLREALTTSSVILLGYRLRDWDFRILFRGILDRRVINPTQSDLRPFSLAIQLDPKHQRGIVSADEIREYLQKYFGVFDFNVEWGTTESFMQNLWEAWNQWR
jgi:hypothetical protein